MCLCVCVRVCLHVTRVSAALYAAFVAEMAPPPPQVSASALDHAARAALGALLRDYDVPLTAHVADKPSAAQRHARHTAARTLTESKTETEAESEAESAAAAAAVWCAVLPLVPGAPPVCVAFAADDPLMYASDRVDE